METKFTPGPWEIATSCSWRRIIGARGEMVCEPITQTDGHPDLLFRNGGADGPDAHLIAAAPDLYAALSAVDASWTEWHPAGPDDPELGAGAKVGADTVLIWKQIRAALLRAQGAPNAGEEDGSAPEGDDAGQ